VDDSTLVRILKALADERRFRMVREIAAGGEMSCGEVGERFDVAQPTISHHLKILVDAQILAIRRQGQHGLVSVNYELVQEAIGGALERLEKKKATTAKRTRRRRG